MNSGPSNSTAGLAPYPWQAELWRSLSQDLCNNRLPHAVLLHGMPGLGKSAFALSFAQALLCTGDGRLRPCGTCKSCKLYIAQTHPDFLLIEPQEVGKAIRIDQVRRLSDFLGQTAQQAGRRCIVINPADAMNLNAANALLKPLEEPPEDTLFLLVSTSISRIAATIRSRCRKIVFHAPSTEQLLTWLMAQNHTTAQAKKLIAENPGQALALLESDLQESARQHALVARQLLDLLDDHTSVIEVAKHWISMESEFVVQTLFGLITISLKPGSERPEALHSVSFDLLDRLAQIPAIALFELYDRVIDAKKRLLSSANLNKALVWEDLLLDWIKLTQIRRSA